MTARACGVWMAFLAGLAALGGCGASPDLVGAWTSYDAEGEQELTFNEANTARWRFDVPVYAGSFDLAYRYDPEASPQELDLFGFTEGPLTGLVLYGIVDFDAGGKSFRFDCEAGYPDDDADLFRPRVFSEETRHFSRVE